MPNAATLERPASEDMPGPTPRGAGQVLHRVALTVNSSLDIKEVLERLARLSLEAIPAERSNLFLVDESGTKLLPTLSIGHVADPGLWSRFRAMDPIGLYDVPERWEAIRRGRAFVIPDMAASPLVPPQFVETFPGRSALIAPLIARGEVVGLLSLDWNEPGRAFAQDEVTLLEAIGGYAALAIRNARLYQGQARKARSLERLVEVAATLNAAASLRSVPDLVCAAFAELLGTSHCSVNLLGDPGPDRVRTVAVRGVPWFTGRAELPLDAVPTAELVRVARLWRKSAEPVVYADVAGIGLVDPELFPSSVTSVALFPLVQPGRLLGAVVAGFPTAEGLGAESLEVGQALADLAASALGRALLDEHLQRRLQQLEVLYRLSDVVAGAADLDTAIREVNEALPADLGLSVRSLSVANRVEREAVGASAPEDDEMEAIRSWRAILAKGRTALRPRAAGGSLLVPIVHLTRVYGALRVDVQDDLPATAVDEELLLAMGAGCAEVIAKAILHRDLAETARRLAVAGERERIARDLHDSVGQILVGMGMRVAQYLPDAPDKVWRERMEDLMQLAGQGSREVRQAIASLLFLQVRKRGLESSLRELTKKFERTTGIGALMKVRGEPAPLPAVKEDALFRAAHEALMNVERHSRASVASVVLTYDDDEVSLSVRDDGIGLGHRDPFGSAPGHFGFRSMQQRLDEVGGRLRVTNARPRGVLVEATVPVTTMGATRAVGAGRHRR